MIVVITRNYTYVSLCRSASLSLGTLSLWESLLLSPSTVSSAGRQSSKRVPVVEWMCRFIGGALGCGSIREPATRAQRKMVNGFRLLFSRGWICSVSVFLLLSRYKSNSNIFPERCWDSNGETLNSYVKSARRQSGALKRARGGDLNG